MGQEPEFSVIAPGFHCIVALAASAEGGSKQGAADPAGGGGGPLQPAIPQPCGGGDGQFLLHIQQQEQVAVNEIHELDHQFRNTAAPEDIHELGHRSAAAQGIQAAYRAHGLKEQGDGVAEALPGDAQIASAEGNVPQPQRFLGGLQQNDHAADNQKHQGDPQKVEDLVQADFSQQMHDKHHGNRYENTHCRIRRADAEHQAYNTEGCFHHGADTEQPIVGCQCIQHQCIAGMMVMAPCHQSASLGLYFFRATR